MCTIHRARLVAAPLSALVVSVGAVLALDTSQAVAASSWTPAGFGGAGAFIGIVFDRAHPGVVYASSDVAGVLRSTDRGDHWQLRSVGLGNLEISSLAVDPFDSSTLYAGAGALAESNRAGMYVSHDAGLSWQLLPGSTAKGMTFRRMRTLDAIAPDPTQRGVIVAGTRGSGIWRTIDSGTTWTQVLAAPSTSAAYFQPGAVPDDPPDGPHPAPVATVAFDPATPGRVYAALDGAGVYTSTSGGVAGSWQAISSGLPAQAPVRDLAASSNGTLYVALASMGVYKSVNGGASWTAVNNNLPIAGLEVSSVAAHPTNPLVAYVSLVTYDVPSIWQTTDGGATWSAQGNVTWDQAHNPTREWVQGQTYSWQVRLDPFNPDRLYYVDFWGIIRSDDAAANSTDRIVGAQDTCVTSLTLDTNHPAGQPDTLYATQWDAGVVASTDRGATWTAVQPRSWQPDVVGHYWDFAVISTGGSKVYLTTSTTGDPETCRVQRSTDARTWTTVLSLPRPPSGFVGAVNLAVDPVTPTTVYAAVDGASVYKSTNRGSTWAPTSGQPGDTSFTYALEVDDHGRVFVGTLRDGLWRSVNGGTTWGRVLDELGAVFRLAVAPGAVYAAGNGGNPNLYRSTDGGTTWQPVTAFPVSDDGDGVGLHGMAVAVDPSNANHIFFAMGDTWHNTDAGAGVAESTDGGATWSMVNSGLGLLSVGVLMVASDGTVYAGTSCGSVWRRDPGGSPCTLTCTGSAPTTAITGAPVSFQGGATPANCNGAPVFDWEFGDGTVHSSQQNPSHTYTSAGPFTWKLTVDAAFARCTRTGSIAVTEPPPAATYIVPSVAHLPGSGGTQWRTDVAAVNRTTGAASITLTYFSDVAPLQRTTSLAAGATTEWRDILVGQFGLGAAAKTSGTLHVTSSTPLGVSSRTYNATAAGTFGQSYPALTAADGLARGRIGLLPQLKSNISFRTNVGVVNLGTASCSALVRLFGVAGNQVGASKTMTVAGGRWLQQSDIFANTGAGNQDLAYATVEVQTTGCVLWTYASVIDQATGDPTTVPVLVQ